MFVEVNKCEPEINVKDRQLTVMLIIQVICISILSMPISIQKVYAEMTLYQKKSSERIIIENFFAAFVVLLALMNTSTSFYLFTINWKSLSKRIKISIHLKSSTSRCRTISRNSGA